jgi:AbrB family looped-hinge helix DNA binding protein
MAETTLAKITRKGQMTIPQELREAMKIKAGDYVSLRPLLGGVFVSKASVRAEVTAEEVLRHLVINIGKQAEAQGITEDKDLDAIVEKIQEQVYQEHYGR